VFVNDWGNLIRTCLPQKDDYVVGFADMRGLLAPEYAGFSSALVLGRRLKKDILDALDNGPTPDYLAHYHQVNRELSDVLAGISAGLTRRGIRHCSLEPTQKDADLDEHYQKTLRLSFSHKMAATRAGLGWIGKTDLLVSYAFGPRLRLASLLLDYPDLATGTPVAVSECGECDLCVQACPAQAASGQAWQAGLDRDEFFNAFRCREKCRELSWKNLGEAVSLCGRCVAICPRGH
jgi:epoxyqueuosine reductase QueG